MLNHGEEICILGNNFIQNRQQFTKLGSQLFYLALSKINPHLPLSKVYNKEFIAIEIPWREVLSMLGKMNSESDKKNIDNNIANLARAAKSLQSATVTNPDREYDAYYDELNIFTRIVYSKRSGLRAEFSHYMTPFLLELSNRPFTQILLNDVCQLNAPHAIRLLEILTIYCYKNKGKRDIVMNISLIDFKKAMFVENKYKDYKEMKRKVIVKSVNEINQLGNYNIKFDEIKDGASVVELVFYVKLPDAVFKFDKQNQTQAPLPTTATEIAVPVTTSTQKQAFVDMLSADERLNDDILANKLSSLGYAEVNTRKHLKQNRDKFLWAVSKTDEAVKKGKVKSYGAYLTTMLKQDVSFDNAMAQAQAEAARRAENERINAQRIAESDAQMKKAQEEANDITKKTIDELKSTIDFSHHFLTKCTFSDKKRVEHLQNRAKSAADELIRRGEVINAEYAEKLEIVIMHGQKEKPQKNKEQASEANYSDVPMPNDDDYYVEPELDDYDFNDVEDMPTPEDYFNELRS